MYLIFDTETTGLPPDFSPPTAERNHWPRLVQLAWQMYDEKRRLVAECSVLVSPDGYEIPAQATLVHGIDANMAYQYGTTTNNAVRSFFACSDRCRYQVAHNLAFDDSVLIGEALRLEADGHEPPPKTNSDLKRICTMQSSTNYCRIPARNGRKGHKWPSLQELHAHLFGVGFDGAHNAMSDVRATALCFFELIDRNVINL